MRLSNTPLLFRYRQRSWFRFHFLFRYNCMQMCSCVLSSWYHWLTLIRGWWDWIYTFTVRDNFLYRYNELLFHEIFQCKACILKIPNRLLLIFLLHSSNFNLRLPVKFFLITIRENFFRVLTRSIKRFIIKCETILINNWLCMSEGRLMHQTRIFNLMMVEWLIRVYTCQQTFYVMHICGLLSNENSIISYSVFHFDLVVLDIFIQNLFFSLRLMISIKHQRFNFNHFLFGFLGRFNIFLQICLWKSHESVSLVDSRIILVVMYRTFHLLSIFVISIQRWIRQFLLKRLLSKLRSRFLLKIVTCRNIQLWNIRRLLFFRINR